MSESKRRPVTTSIVRCVPGCGARAACGGPVLGACYTRALREDSTHRRNSDVARARNAGKKK